MLTTIWLSGAFAHFHFHSSMVAVALEMRSSYFPRFSQPLLSHLVMEAVALGTAERVPLDSLVVIY